MAIYPRLSLKYGGGIISSQQQGEQVKNTATILIGLGGTGLDCLKAIKAAVKERLRPDDPEAAVPEYSHIQFLGVDSDQVALSKSGLEMEECLDISGPMHSGMAENPAFLKMRPELQWIDEKLLELWKHYPFPGQGNGSGGIRQSGRFMMMESSAAFMDILEKKIATARRGISYPDVNIHIFSGLSGGTGSGCFLDVCYMVREVLREMGCEGAVVSGYFFLPEAKEENISWASESVRKKLRMNGYAALQELDYTMGTQYNGGVFQQVYHGGKEIPWDRKPVDMCFLIGSNSEGEVQPYERVIDAVTEYILELCTEREDSKSNMLRIILWHDNWAISTLVQLSTRGIYLDYRSLNALSIYVPFREMNTYLMSGLLGMFEGIRSKEPTQEDVRHFAEKAGLGDYELLCRELSQGAGDNYSPFPGTWQEVKEYGDRDMVIHYTNQTDNKKGVIEKNAKSISDERNSWSLIGRVREALVPYIKSLEYGPMYACRMLEELSVNNLFRVIDALMEKNAHFWHMEKYQDRYEEYEVARDAFHRSSILAKRRRYEEYVYRLEILEKHKLALVRYEQMDRVLRTLRSQMQKAAAEYYCILARVIGNLLETAKENRRVLYEGIRNTNDFGKPLITLEEMKPKLDQLLESINPASMMEVLMEDFLNPESLWIQEDENAIAKMVNDFFVNKSFHDFANRSITGFLGYKYSTDNREVIADRLYEEYMKELTEQVKPLFAFNTTVWNGSQTGKDGIITVPKGAATVINAAMKLHESSPLYEVQESKLKYRVYLRRKNCGFPIYSHKKIKEYEELYYSSPIPPGLHSYVGNEKGFFSDWNHLPPLTPESGIEYGKIPQRLKVYLEEANEIYDKSRELGLLKGDEVFCLDEEQGLKPSGHVLPHGSQVDEITIERVRRDFFVRSPAIWEGLKKDIEVLEKQKKLSEQKNAESEA